MSIQLIGPITTPPAVNVTSTTFTHPTQVHGLVKAVRVAYLNEAISSASVSPSASTSPSASQSNSPSASQSPSPSASASPSASVSISPSRSLSPSSSASFSPSPSSPSGATQNIRIESVGINHPAMLILSLNDWFGDMWFFPKTVSHLNTTGAAISNEYMDGVPVFDQVKVTLSECNDNDYVKIWLLVEDWD